MKKTIIFGLFIGLLSCTQKETISNSEYVDIFGDSVIVNNQSKLLGLDRERLVSETYLNCLRNYPIDFKAIESTVKTNGDKTIVTLSYYCISEYGDRIMMIGTNTFDSQTKTLLNESYIETLEKIN